MRTMQRAVAMVGLTLMTGGVMAVTATAASAAPTQAESSAQSTEARHDNDGGWHDDDDFGRRGFRDRDHRVFLGIYRSRGACERAAWWVEETGQYDDADCDRIGRRRYVLTAERDHHRRWH